jgi:Putative zinc-finger
MNTSTETCPSLEDLAAFLEGRLTGDERARIVAHLADCPDCYEIFAEAARFELSEEEDEEEKKDVAAAPIGVPREPLEDPPSGKVIPFPSRPVFRWVSSIAAALAVVALGIPLHQQYYAIPELSAQELVSPGLAQDEFWSQWTNRGTADSVSIESTPHEFLLGAHLVDLRLSLARKNEPGMDDALARINGHLAEFGTRADMQAKFYAAARVQLSQGRLPQDFLQQAERMEASLRPEEYPYLAFGKWTEAGRLSALNQDPDFFQDPENRKFLRAFLYQEKDLESEVETDLKEIQETLTSTAPSSLPYQELQQKFEKILTFYQNKSKEDLVPAGPSPAP